MEKPRVYVETTIPSAYFDERRAPAMVARREATRRWWSMSAERYERVTSPAVFEELRAGPHAFREAWLELIADVRLLDRAADPRHRFGLQRFQGDAARRCAASRVRLVPRLRLPLDLGFAASGESKQVSTHSMDEPPAGPVRPSYRRSACAVWEGITNDHDVPNPLVDEIRAIRAQIWREHGGDLQRVYEHYVELQKQFKGPLVSASWTPDEELAFQKGLEELRRCDPMDCDLQANDVDDPEFSERASTAPASRPLKQERPAA